MIYLIVAYDKNRVIGKDNAMPWYFKEDLAYFKKITSGYPVLMGRNTYQSILDRIKKPLPDRKNIVVSRTLEDDRVEITQDLDGLIKQYETSEDVLFVIGGASIYEATLPYATRLYVTHIDKTYSGDTYFPVWDETLFTCIETENTPPLTFNIYERRTL